MADGFLGRWSQRKLAVKQGVELDVPAAAIEPLPEAHAVVPANNVASEPSGGGAKAEVPSMADVQALNAESDFAPFVGRTVAPDVRNAAMKKLFSDPHYSVMDRLDIYIDDYSKPDPLPLAMLRQMASAKFLNLFEEEEDAEKPAAAPTQKLEPQHENTDLRLQPDDASGPRSPGGGAE
jgi:hypothetical protein